MLSYYAFKIPFKTPFEISSQTLTSRNGILLVYDTGDFHAFGEIAPLPGFSKESIEQVLPVLLQNQKHLETAFKNNEADQFISILDGIHQLPSLSFGLDSLAADLGSKKNNLTLSQHLFQKQLSNPKVNGAIGINNVAESLEKAAELIKNGITTLKIKVGADNKKEREIIEAVRKKYPKVKIRIDANQAWNTNEAIELLTDLEQFDIEYCEQPVSEFELEGMKKVKESVGIPIAADEAVRSLQQAKQLIAANACDLLIIKPSLFGRIKNCIVTKEWANSHGIDVVVTTAFDTIVGRTITAVLASGLGSEKYAHGLATGRFLNEPWESLSEIHQGTYILPKAPGVGRTIDLSYFKKIS